LDVIDASVADRGAAVRIVVFDVDAQAVDELRPWFPLRDRPLMTPVVAYWRDGKFVEGACGYAGRHLVYRLLGLDPKASDEFVVEQPKRAAV
jgi:hypothetical protein